MTLQWVGVDLLTGAVIADLPDIELSDVLAVTIGQAETATLNLHVQDSTNPDWLDATNPGGAAIIAWMGDPTAPTVVWGGIVLQRIRDMSNIVSLSLSTPECYLDACLVGDYGAVGENQDSILADLIGFATGTGQVPFVLDHLAAASSATQSVSYADTDQVSVLSAIQALSALSGGPEWVTGWSWDLAAGTIFPMISYGQRVGLGAVDSSPNVVFELADLQQGSTYTEDYSSGYGANQVIAYGAASSVATSGAIQFAEATSSDTAGRPLWTYTYQPSTAATTVADLTPYVEQALTQMTNGAAPFAATIANDLPGKQLGIDWSIGDDIGFIMSGPAFPEPVMTTARTIGYQIDVSTVTPILQGDDS